MEKINWAIFKGHENPILDAYRCIRANLYVVMLERNLKVIAFTSLAKEKEKSILVGELGIAIAQTGKKVLLIDGNNTDPVYHILFDIANVGITDSLSKGIDFFEAIQHCMEQPNLDILTSGTATIDSEDFLIGDSMQRFLNDVKNKYDCILLDIPSVEKCAIAVEVGAKADGVVLMLNRNIDYMNEVIIAKDKLEQAGATVLGCVLK